MNIIVGLKILLFILWIYFLSVFKRGKLIFFQFMLGCAGLFFFVLNFIGLYKYPFIYDFTSGLKYIGDFTGIYQTYPKYSTLFIDYKNTVISLYIDLECSGLLEIITFICITVFLPFFKITEKIKWCLFGAFIITIFNYIRLLTIIIIVRLCGVSVFGLAHSVIGRLIFWVLMICLFFHVFTKTQLKRQKVGSFSYDSDFK